MNEWKLWVTKNDPGDGPMNDNYNSNAPRIKG